ncbi:type I-E CRISPR-associated protein Cse2/CasB [Actinocorallia sp. API 0066]|uniref:type I-E CRISPR-associated protein Cse2/CasB n=1 Tax=Actinocorallia sp. API 0066 TaxID=2896846 RepID=UPI001E62ADCD|nr:type I-E CRISPR-associated protein Cse2/CasB [Actinocorallia sp. API 0066]MCD0452842.1 type I-E CRISPR-associated protein Cse2/CasB [Actinocorallia sp. API 0066]
MTLYYWNRIDAEGEWSKTGLFSGPPPGEDLAAMRAGLGRGFGEVPRLWPLYRSPVDDEQAKHGWVSVDQQAEHAALSLYGLHQQSKQRSMHRPGVRPGIALLRLRQHGKFSEDAVDRKVNAAATTTSPEALLISLRGLVDLLRTIDQPMDYDALRRLVRDWHHEDSRRRARRQLAVDYQAWTKQPDGDAATTS